MQPVGLHYLTHSLYLSLRRLVSAKQTEIPQALELIGKGAEQKISADGTHDEHRFSKKRIFLPALLRLSVGYMFLMCLFMTVVQESVVLDIFFDVLVRFYS